MFDKLVRRSISKMAAKHGAVDSLFTSEDLYLATF